MFVLRTIPCQAGSMARIDLPPGEELDVIRAFSLRPDLAAGASAYDGAVWNSSLDWRLHELVRMRVAQINQCTVCLAWRTPQAGSAGATEELLTGVDGWRHQDDYTAAEQTAIEFAERYC